MAKSSGSEGATCPGCNITYEAPGLSRCPKCGGQLRVRGPGAETADSISLSLSYQVYRCDRCGEEFVLDRGLACPRCREPSSQTEPWDPSAGQRIEAFGDRVSLVSDMSRMWHPDGLEFARRGKRPDPVEHFRVLAALSTDHLRERFDDATGLLTDTSWSPDEGSAHAALDRLVDICTDLFFGAAAIARTAPPVSMVAVHRQAARVVSRTAVAISVFLEALVSPFLEDASVLQSNAQQALDEAGESAHRLGEFTNLTERQISMEPGWWATKDDYDTGRVVWEAMGAASATVSDGAQRVRRALAGVPGITDLPDEFAFQLLPGVSLAFYDPVRLVEKARAARNLLDRAAPTWIGDTALLVSETLRGHRQLVDQTVQLGFQLRNDAPRKILLRAATDVYSKLVEGPFRRFGTILDVANRSRSRKAVVYARQEVEAISPADVINHLGSSSAILIEGTSTLLRNAEAHYEFEVTDTGIEFRDKRIERGRVVGVRHDFLTDDDFIEELAALDETIVAFELALLPYVWSHASADVQMAIQQSADIEEERRATVIGLAGLKGFVDMSIDSAEGRVDITARYVGQQQNPYLEVLPALASIWASWDVQSVIVSIANARSTSSHRFERSAFPQMDDRNEWINQHRMALFLRDLRLATEGVEGRQAELDVRTVLLPVAIHVLNGGQRITEGGSPNRDAMGPLLGYLRWIGDLLPSVQVSDSVVELRDGVVELAIRMAGEIKAWSTSLSRADAGWAMRCERRFRRSFLDLDAALERMRSFMSDDWAA